MPRTHAAIVLLATFAVLPARAQSHEVTSPQGNKIHVSWSAPVVASTVSAQAQANMTYHGGPVMRNATNYLIFWQPPGRAAFPAGYQTAMEKFFGDVSGTPLFNIVTQYGDGGSTPPNTTSWAGSWSTTAASSSGCDGTQGTVGNPPNCPMTDGDVRAVVTAALTANPSWGPANINTLYWVFTPSDVQQCSGPDKKDNTQQDCFATSDPIGPNQLGKYCGYHSAFNTNTQYAYIPFAENGSCYGPPNGYPNGVNNDIALSVVSHELIEAVTDPHLDAWYDSSGNEIGDKCAYLYGFVAPDGTNFVLNGNRYVIQLEYSNAITGCAKRYGTDPNLSLPASVAFGLKPPGSSSQLPLPVTNTSGGDANILYMAKDATTNAAFSLLNVPPTWATLAAGNSISPAKQVQFAPPSNQPPANLSGSITFFTDQTACASTDSTCTKAFSGALGVPLSGTVVLPPSLTKSFGGSTIPQNTDRQLTFTVTNPNTVLLTGVGFTDTLPAGMVVSTPAVLNSNCGGVAFAGSNVISLTSGSVIAGSSCQVTVNIRSSVPGTVTNTTSVITSTEAGNGKAASAQVTVVAPPSIIKGFSLLAIPVGGSATTTFTVTNPNTTVALTISFNDALPAALQVGTPANVTNTCGGTVTATAGSGSVVLAGGSLAAASTCAVTVTVTGVAGTGVATNSVTINSVEGGTGNTSQATIAIGDIFSLDYMPNLAQGDSVVNLTNTGASGANLCANVFVFSPDEQLVSCCACPITPNALASLSARADLISNTLTPAVPGAIVVKLIASQGAGTCNPGSITPATLAPGLEGWGSKLHNTPSGFQVSETPFVPGSLSLAEFNRVVALCGFLQGNGSGYGICKSCRSGALGGVKQ